MIWIFLLHQYSQIPYTKKKYILFFQLFLFILSTYKIVSVNLLNFFLECKFLHIFFPFHVIHKCISPLFVRAMLYYITLTSDSGGIVFSLRQLVEENMSNTPLKYCLLLNFRQITKYVFHSIFQIYLRMYIDVNKDLKNHCLII